MINKNYSVCKKVYIFLFLTCFIKTKYKCKYKSLGTILGACEHFKVSIWHCN